jgi:hypothetical protein
MKKFVIGCLVTLGLFTVVGGIGLYFAYDRLIKPGMEMAGNVKELAKLGEIEKQVRNTGPFEPPQGDELTQQMVKRFVEVQQQVETNLGPRMADLKAKYDQLDRSLKEDGHQSVSFRQLAEGLTDLTAIVLQGKTAQVEALNRAGFSVKEYAWVRQHVYAAVGITAVGFDVQKLATEAKEGNLTSTSPRSRQDGVGDVPEQNKTLVAPYEEQLKTWAPLAFFGL